MCKHIHLANIHKSQSNESQPELPQASMSSNQEENSPLKERGNSLSHDTCSNDLQTDDDNQEPEYLLTQSAEILSDTNSNTAADESMVNTLSVDYLSSQLSGKPVSEVEKLRDNVIATCK